jgi:antirestriction protein ArdC
MLRTSERIDEVMAALAAARPRFPAIRRNKTVTVRRRRGGPDVPAVTSHDAAGAALAPGRGGVPMLITTIDVHHSPSRKGEAMSTYDCITAAILQRLTDGVVPWHRPWTAGVPRNLLSRQPYRGINVWLTVSTGFASPYWLTLKQANALGGRIQPGARGTPVVFWQWDDADDEGTPHPRRRPLVRTYTVFNLEQTTGIDAPGDPDPPGCQPLARCDAVVAHMPQRPRIQQGAARAAYAPRLDVSQMPHPAWFDAPEAYYSTLFHELTHSTGHASRLHRATLTEPCPFGSPADSQEELVAEMGAAFLCGVCGIENRTVDNSTAYIASWLRVLAQGTRLVIIAAAQAQRAADYIQGAVPVERDA